MVRSDLEPRRIWDRSRRRARSLLVGAAGRAGEDLQSGFSFASTPATGACSLLRSNLCRRRSGNTGVLGLPRRTGKRNAKRESHRNRNPMFPDMPLSGQDIARARLGRASPWHSCRSTRPRQPPGAAGAGRSTLEPAGQGQDEESSGDCTRSSYIPLKNWRMPEAPQ